MFWLGPKNRYPQCFARDETQFRMYIGCGVKYVLVGDSGYSCMQNKQFIPITNTRTPECYLSSPKLDASCVDNQEFLHECLAGRFDDISKNFPHKNIEHRKLSLLFFILTLRFVLQNYQGPQLALYAVYHVNIL